MQTEETTADPIRITKPKPASKPKATRIDGASLVPPTSSTNPRVVADERWYWVGVLPECPRGSLDLCGISFPKVSERIIRAANGDIQRIPYIGALVKLSASKIQHMRERLPRTVIRFVGKPPEPLVGFQDVGAAQVRPVNGHPITIPTEEEIKARKAKGWTTRQYRPDPNDAPAARFMFAVLCEDQEKGNRGETYPQPLEVTGLEWPGDLD